MRKPVSLLLITPFFLSFPLHAQKTLRPGQWNKIIYQLEAENWKKAAKFSGRYLHRIGESDTGEAAANLRYMYLCSISGQLGSKRISKDDALRRTKGLIGQTVLFPGHPVREKGLFNSITLAENSKDTISVCEANQACTQIFSMEHIAMAVPFGETEMQTLEGKFIRLKAVIQSIDTGGFAFPHFVVMMNAGTWREE